jgi:hypothetical protein
MSRVHQLLIVNLFPYKLTIVITKKKPSNALNSSNEMSQSLDVSAALANSRIGSRL